MEKITKKELITILESSEGRKTNIKITGYIQAELNFEKLKFEIINEEWIILKDIETNNRVSCNYNEIRRMEKNENKMLAITIDDDVNTKIEINIK